MTHRFLRILGLASVAGFVVGCADASGSDSDVQPEATGTVSQAIAFNPAPPPANSEPGFDPGPGTPAPPPLSNVEAQKRAMATWRFVTGATTQYPMDIYGGNVVTDPMLRTALDRFKELLANEGLPKPPKATYKRFCATWGRGYKYLPEDSYHNPLPGAIISGVVQVSCHNITWDDWEKLDSIGRLLNSIYPNTYNFWHVECFGVGPNDHGSYDTSVAEIDPEPARLNTTLQPGFVASATYVNTNASTYGVQASASWTVSSTPAGTPCSTNTNANLQTNTILFGSIQAAGSLRKCLQ